MLTVMGAVDCWVEMAAGARGRARWRKESPMVGGCVVGEGGGGRGGGRRDDVLVGAL